MTTPHRDTPSLYECQAKLRELAGTVGQGVLELRKARDKWANLIRDHEVALVEKKRVLSRADAEAYVKAKAQLRSDGKLPTVQERDKFVAAECADQIYDVAVEEALLRHAKRMADNEIKDLEGRNDARQHERAIWKALLESVMEEMRMAGTPPPNRYGRTG